ncbi:mRNA interferase HigB [Parabacteroides sp. PF5-5]|uniref:type II toxin-antitoxin system HigB family toxin n=1 Tax=unclassified Parabacteroides TaxID=2649774 RepID=UPI0024733D84|nr:MULTISPECIES: type II toxin-antitoxin system HigB family toxin [unclassified Parabacteroides]MDH6303410.1 mRNA interferase HigB [Parabacteroides sp. PH5-39]MDH6314733.1 mRNA interferase HigB [Parabacteroides sp. PF5-13]MDH6318070.1 mRNA interferase HigB [Parabacteroides sp. PH5-13]MDH6321999.1 mRNA interferase HigB [Parabacteroides sp. PH5-8]MDH6326122.1 mRNA interferase HigB [Parabacteroides sp. PH5-41]
MRIIAYSCIEEFTRTYNDSKVALDSWYSKVEKAEWDCFADAKAMFNSIDSVGNKRYVFNIKGNTYRLIALILFTPKIVYIRHICPHSDYDKIKDCSKV